MSVTSVFGSRVRKQPKTLLPGLTHSRRSSSLTAPGFLFVFVTLFLALGAINGQNNLLFWLFGFSIASLIVSGVITGTALIAVRLEAQEVEPAELGEPIKVKYTLYNTSKLFPNFALEISELNPIEQSERQGCKPDPAVILHLRPRNHKQVVSHFYPLTRGLLTLHTVRVRTRFPFGLFSKSIEFDCPRQTVVYPERVALNQKDLNRIAKEDIGTTRSVGRRGNGLDYYSIREYQSGDPLRKIAWKQSARTASLRVIEYPEPAEDAITLSLMHPDEDISDELFERGVSIMYSMLKFAEISNRVSMMIPFAQITFSFNTGQAHFARCARALSLIQRPEPGQDRSRRRPNIRGSWISVGFERSSNPGYCVYAEDYVDRNSE